MANFFQKFPKVDLKYTTTSGTPITLSYTDIYRFVDLDKILSNDYSIFETIQIEDGERADKLSQRLYNTPDFYWTFFLINEHLKNGIAEWPMSTVTLDRHIQNKYNKYGVCTIVPNFLFTDDNDLLSGTGFIDLLDGFNEIDLLNGIDSAIPVSNYMQGLTLSHPYLRVKRVTSNYSGTKNESIIALDDNRYQLWLTNDNDPFFFADANPDVENSDQIQIILINPYDEGSEKYEEVAALNSEWIESTKEWYESIHGQYVGIDYESDLLDSLFFTVKNFYETGSIAPDYFINPTTGDRLCNLFCNLTNTGSPVTNVESEETRNDSRRFIKTLKPSAIYRFIDKYNLVLNETGRLQI